MANSSSISQRETVKVCEWCGASFTKSKGGCWWHFQRRRFCSNKCVGFSSAKHRPLTDRLFEFVDKRGDDECWLWTARTTKFGYGTFRFHNKDITAHRASYEIANGPIPKGLVICHRCDVPRCVNPNHLFAGTQAENMQDMYRKGRDSQTNKVRGEKHHSAKLTAEDVLAMRSSPLSQRALARQYGLAQSSVNAIILKKVWAHI